MIWAVHPDPLAQQSVRPGNVRGMGRSAWWLFIAGSLLWGLPYLFIKIAVDEFSPWAVVWLRCLVAALVLLPLALHRRVLGQLRGRLRPLFLLALLEVTAPFTLISAGEQHISSSLGGLLIAALPLFVAVLAIRLDPAERAVGLRLLGLLIGMAGVAAVLGFDVSGDRSALLGSAMVLVAALSYAFATFLVKRSFSETSALAISAMAVTINAVILAPLGLMGLPGRSPSAAAVSGIVVLGLLCTAAGLLVYFALITIAGPGRATVITYVNPAVAVALGVTILDEPLTAATVAGFLLIIAGSWLSTGGRPRARLLARTGRPAQPFRQATVPATQGESSRPPN
jgi:drug/metabolite transporter (DMT)-like permease